MPYYGDTLPYYYGGPFSNHSSLMTGIGRTLHSPLGSTRYAPHLTTISESPLSALRRYSPAATLTPRPKRIIDTADIDVSTPRALSSAHNTNEHRNRLRRDRPTIRIRSQALKDNPALREHYERHEKTVGELLVEKFLIKDKKATAGTELRTKLYSQVSLEDDLTKKQRDEFQEAIQRRITRRMTRRRSSADVQMDPEQLEREVLFAQAQADALDNLVAEEQAEIEVEARMGTLIRKNLVRSVAPLTRSSRDIQGISGDNGDDTRTKKLAKKVKKRKKMTDKPSPPSESDLDSEHDVTRSKKTPKDRKEETNDKVDKAPMILGHDETSESLDHKSEEEYCNETSSSPSTALKFKIEASNSVGDFSTLWINASIAEEHEKQRKYSQDVIEQFRDSIRLPAPKQSVDEIPKNKKKDAIIEEHQQTVVIPVKKRYLKDEARNSVYLTLKTQKYTELKNMADMHDKIDKIEAIDDTVNQSPSSSSSSSVIINGNTNDAERSRNISSMADDTTSAIKRQPRVNKVAKFWSKDITESDVEVKSISELTGAEVTTGKIGTKGVSLQNSSGVDDDTSNAVVSESISGSSNLDKNERSSFELKDDRSSDRTPSAKHFTISKDVTTNLDDTKNRDTDDNFKIDTNTLVIDIKALPTRDDKSPVGDGVTGKSRENDTGGKIGKPLVKRAKKNNIKDLQEKNICSVGDESKRLKRSVASALDSSNIGVCSENAQDRKNDEKEQLGDGGTEPSAARITSAVTPFSNLVESLPNASTINFPDVTNGLTITPKIQREKSNVKGIENEEAKITENSPVNENLSSSGKITGKLEDTRSEISKPLGVLGENSEVNSLVKDEARNVVGRPATTESVEILTPTNSYVNFAQKENDERLAAQPSQKVFTDVQATTTKQDKDVVELPKLYRTRKVLPFSSGNNSAETVKLSSLDSPDLQVVSDVPGKNQMVTNKRSIAASNDANVSSPTIKNLIKDQIKDTVQVSSVAKKSEDSLDKQVESMQRIPGPSKLTNGTTDKKPNTVVQIKNLATSDSKAASKVKVFCAHKDEEIDFWGEIASDTKSSGKFDRKIDHSKEVTRGNGFGDPTNRDGVGDSMVTVLEFETKSEALPESGTREETETLVVADAKKSNKVKKKKKKPSEDGGCKKKDQQEKASTETIFERFKISDDAIDEEGHQCAERLEQQSKKLDETSISADSFEEKICEDPVIDIFGRNLSTIVEESPSPITEQVPKSVEAFDLFASTVRKKEEGSTPKLDSTKDSSSFNGNSEGREDTLEKDIPASVSTSLDKPEVPLSRVPVEPEKKSSTDAALLNFKTIVPSINIIVPPGTPPKKENQPEVEPEEDFAEAAEEDPGTPTNETIDDNKIAKWHGLVDLSLDEPDKDIGPEVALGTALKDSSKKKAGVTKKTSKKSTNSTTSTGSNQDSSKKKKLGKKKKSSTKTSKTEPEKKVDERSSSQVSNSSDATLKPSGQNLLYSPKDSGCNSPKQRPMDLIKMFYTTPVSLLTATPRDLSKVRRAKIKKRKHSSRTASASSDSTGSTRSTQSTGTAESTASTEHEDDTGQKRISSTRSNDSGFDGSPRLSNCDMACHKKCEKLTGNLCGLNQKLVAEALQALKRAPSQSSDNQRNSDGSDHHASGRITPPATNLPRFKKYTVTDFNFLKVLGKGSFGKVLLAELRRTDCVYAVKCLKKDVVLEDDDVECTLIERKVLTLATRHPYLCHLFCTFQTDSHLFFVMEYLNGGDLMFHIQKSGRFAESRARFYAAEIWSGLNFLHKKGIVYRDLKLDNVLLDFEGHIRIADFGMCKLQIFLDRTADTFCGTPDYMAPEIIKGLKYNQAVDWWSFGVLMYEMLTGQSPFSGCDEDELFWSICNERPFIPRYLSQEAMDVLTCLLEKDAGKRPPAHEISIHPFFHSLQWDRLERRQLEPPFKPALEHTLDTRYFDTAFTAERPRLTPVPEQILTSMDQGVFRGFSYTNPNATD